MTQLSCNVIYRENSIYRKKHEFFFIPQFLMKKVSNIYDYRKCNFDITPIFFKTQDCHNGLKSNYYGNFRRNILKGISAL